MLILFVATIHTICKDNSFEKCDRQDLLDTLVESKIQAKNEEISLTNNLTYKGALFSQIVREGKNLQNTFQQIAANSLIPDSEVVVARKALQRLGNELSDIRFKNAGSVDMELKKFKNDIIQQQLIDPELYRKRLF